jgi:arylsulfatase A-like enzyme
VRAGLVLALAVAGCGGRCAAPPDRPNVLLVTVDTLRADHVGAYGATLARTPALDRLAAEGALFTHAWSQTHVTVPSHLTLMTSLPLAVHGALDNGMAPRGRVASLPALFRAAGWTTAAFVSAHHLGRDGPLGRALADFRTWEEPGRMPARAGETNARVERWLAGGCREPFFAWVHYFDPHMPYDPPPPFDAAYYTGDPRDPAHDGMARVHLRWFFRDLGRARAVLGERAAVVRALKRDLRLSSRGVRRLVLHPEERRAADARLDALAAHLRARTPLKPGVADWLAGVHDVRFPRARYAGEVSYVDHAIGALRRLLEARGVARRTVVLVTADHGEGLGEHDVWFTHYGLHEPMLRVPLVIWAPGRVPAARHDAPARGLDVAPTLLRLAGLPVPASMQGRDLLAPGGAPPEAVLAEAEDGRQVAIVDGRWKLIRTLRRFHLVDGFARDAGAVELYELRDDPGELHDRAAERPDVVAALATRLEPLARAHAAATPGAAPSPELAAQLRALGYVE